MHDNRIHSNLPKSHTGVSTLIDDEFDELRSIFRRVTPEFDG